MKFSEFFDLTKNNVEKYLNDYGVNWFIQIILPYIYTNFYYYVLNTNDSLEEIKIHAQKIYELEKYVINQKQLEVEQFLKNHMKLKYD